MRVLISIFVIMFLASCQQGNSRQEKASEANSAVELQEEVLNIGKMHCEMCVLSIEKGLGSVEGVEFVKVNLVDSTAAIRYDRNKTNIDEFKKVIEKRGYILKDKDL